MHRSGQKQVRNGQLLRLLRRSAAFFTATVTILLFYATTEPELSSSLLSSLAESPAFVAAALRAELGRPETQQSLLNHLPWWQSAVLAETVLLRDGEDTVTTFLSRETTADASEPVHSEVRPSPGANGDMETLLEDEGEEEIEIPAMPEADTGETIVERTLLPGTSSNYVSAGGVYINNRAQKSLDWDALAAEDFSLPLGDAPQVLIYHTHGSESYAREGEDVYVETDPARTNNNAYNMVRVGDELAAVLKANGISVIHDRTLYDYPQYNSSYSRSLEGMLAYLEKYPSIRVMLDLHRDALVSTNGTIYKTVAMADGEKVAQLLLVVGSDAGGQPHAKWKENLHFAVALQQQISASWPDLARPITLRSSRFNQQVSTGALLIEVGTHGNTLQEALRSARLLGYSLSSLLLDPS
jgi:stage II sporulation protein P